MHISSTPRAFSVTTASGDFDIEISAGGKELTVSIEDGDYYGHYITLNQEDAIDFLSALQDWIEKAGRA